MKAKKSLQKFTESDDKIDKILCLEVIRNKDLKHLSKDEYNLLIEIINEEYRLSKGIEKDKIVKKIKQFISATTKNQIWENNNNQITVTISNLMQEYGRMPTKTEIANKSELSRQTVHKHLKEYTNHPEYLGQIEQFRIMNTELLAKVFQFAINGDTGAAKLYFNIMGFINMGQTPNNTLIKNQNNYIQINGTVLSQESIKHLKPEQLNTIETILKTALPEPKSLEVKS